MKNQKLRRFEWLDVYQEGEEILEGAEEWPGPVADCHGEGALSGDSEYLVYDRETDTVYTTGPAHQGGERLSAVQVVEETVLEQERR
jgi:hypothetical protein